MSYDPITYSLVSLFLWDTSEEVVELVLVVPAGADQEVNIDDVIEPELDRVLGSSHVLNSVWQPP